MSKVLLFKDIPLELLATVAAQILEDDKYDEAADRAFRLIEACYRRTGSNSTGYRSEISTAKDKIKIREEFRLTPQDGDVVPWGPGVKRITAQERPDRATDAFQSLMELYGRNEDPPWTPKDLNLRMTHYKQGFSIAEILKYESDYAAFRASGCLDMKRAPVEKKSGDVRKSLVRARKSKT